MASDIRRELVAAVNAVFRGGEVPPVPTGRKASRELGFLADEYARQGATGHVRACVEVAILMSGGRNAD